MSNAYECFNKPNSSAPSLPVAKIIKDSLHSQTMSRTLKNNDLDVPHIPKQFNRRHVFSYLEYVALCAAANGVI